MGDAWDYKLRKMEMAWELASRIIPKEPQSAGAWSGDNYLKKVQETLNEVAEIMDVAFDDTYATGVLTTRTTRKR